MVEQYIHGLTCTKSFSNVFFCCQDGCFACCRRAIGPGLTENDYQRISKHTSRSDIANIRDHPIFPYNLKTQNGACIYLTNDGKCDVYSVRPLLCRLYPLQLHIQWDGKLLWCLEYCPGVGAANGIDIDDEYLQNQISYIQDLESDNFIELFKQYILSTKHHNTLLFKTDLVRVLSNWETKITAKNIIWQMFNAEALRDLTAKGRLECVKHELLPFFKFMIIRDAVLIRKENAIFVDACMLLDVLKKCKKTFDHLAHESFQKEIIHLRNMENQGTVAREDEKGLNLYSSKESLITIRKYNGHKILVDAAKLMQMLPISREAAQIEEKYLSEFQRREGRYGTISTDLTLDEEVELMFLAADAVELKANAFAIDKGKKDIGIDDIREAIWIVERSMHALLKKINEHTSS